MKRKRIRKTGKKPVKLTLTKRTKRNKITSPALKKGTVRLI